MVQFRRKPFRHVFTRTTVPLIREANHGNISSSFDLTPTASVGKWYNCIWF